ncbi:unnamed protein product [Oppiella nova]|uniref:Uncharacterized protein n=1 Tax=Oppiella nova TaxID=334625 RepID=A0A7R9MMD2_9ACAR|nr:unnamed protein product [Oppiella nova]CAG2179846.1 unnamed protein product [Oppiella nova]
MLPRTPCALNYAVVIITQSVAICLCEPLIDASGDKQLIRALAEDNWFGRLAINLLSYSVILIPSALIVFMVKNRLCVQSVSDNYLVKLFVFGKHDTILDNGYHNSGSDFSDSEKLLPITVNDTADGKQLSPKSSSASSSPIRTRRITLLLYCFLGLQISYLSWGLLQEKIMTTEYVIRSEFFAEGLHNRHFTAVAERLAPVPAPEV